MPEKKISFVAADSQEALAGKDKLVQMYGQYDPESADVIVPLGGDGFMLHAMHTYLSLGVPLYGMNTGTVGFLMNAYAEDDFLARLERAEQTRLHPLDMTAKTADGEEVSAIAFNEVSLLRETRQAAKLRISVDGNVRLEELVCDGVLVATAAGSSAYNLSAAGPILPLGSDILALTPISAFRPRRWRGALLPCKSEIKFEIQNFQKRPTSAVADYKEVRNVVEVSVREDRDVGVLMLFDPDHSLEERILLEQFVH